MEKSFPDSLARDLLSPLDGRAFKFYGDLEKALLEEFNKPENLRRVPPGHSFCDFVFWAMEKKWIRRDRFVRYVFYP